jgi:hypothetical protein
MRLHELRDHPVFLCGHPKSGTTLLRSILDNHPELVVYPDETFFLRGFLNEAKHLNRDQKIALAMRYLMRLFEVHENHPENLLSYPPEERRYFAYTETCKAFEMQISSEEGLHHDGYFLSAVILAYGQVFGALTEESQYWVEKSTYNELFVGRIFAWWPEARCIQITREPRDIFASYKRKHKALAPELFARRWRGSAETGLKNQKHYGEDRYLILRYEDLVQEPEAQIEKLVDFLHIRDDAVLRVPSRNGVPWEGNSMFADKFSQISTKPLGRWARELDRQDVQIIEKIAGSAMEACGYPTGAGISLSAYVHMARWQLRQFRSNWIKAMEEKQY